MKAITPVVKGLEKYEVEWARNQKEYRTLPAITYTGSVRVPVTSRWQFTKAERKAIAEGADLYLTLLTFGGPLAPMMLQVFMESEAECNLTQQGIVPSV